MYRCSICRGASPPRQKRLLHVVQRPQPARNGGGTEIAQELPVCRSCQRELASGVALGDLKRRMAGKIVETMLIPTTASGAAVEVSRYSTKPVALGRPRV